MEMLDTMMAEAAKISTDQLRMLVATAQTVQAHGSKQDQEQGA